MKTFALGLLATAVKIGSLAKAANTAPAVSFAPLPATFAGMEHPTLTRARKVLGTAPAGSPRAPLRSGSFAFTS